ncbi:(Fe-S)-binding protein [Desmospora profundinema]|uniref:L-lactate dehydrogenase complex protein LldE n=1 Tax=Desmospora profundinema TaxID=1571184 RepID=A0ABU1IND4_9BACL|nr:(Fe-S)-binding protein [Desmospora profundinema]MDR6226277.1 L-lactate dehydrogenase complex protein LldE [Desmospora profundinema]
MRVGLFITCLSDVFYPEVGTSMVRVLRRLGAEIDFPEGQTCCGQPAFNSGYQQEAKRAARQMIQTFEGFEAVVTPSGSCAAMVRHYYPALFSGEAEWERRAEQFASRCFEFSEFMVKNWGDRHLPVKMDGTATYHHSCHMYRMLDLSDPPIRLLSQVEGLTLKELPYHQDCCGFGGTFAVKMADISTAMADEKVDHVCSTGADYLIGSDMSCLMHLGGRIRRKGHPVEVLHVAQVLDRGWMS